MVLLAGQSNMVGFGLGFDAALDGTPDPRIGQWSQAGGRGRIVAAIDPLLHPGAAARRVGLGLSFARAYIAARPPGRRILLVPAAVGGTGFANGRWNPGDDLFEAALKRTSAALAAAPNACLAAILDALAHLADTVPRTVDVSADGLTGNPGDKIHFDAASQRILGRRYFEALRTLLPAPRAAKP